VITCVVDYTIDPARPRSSSASPEDGKIYPACIAGEGACPPEDSGGAYGFADLKEILAGPPTDERYEMQAWAGEDYDPGRFDLAAANAAVAAV
jgi:hypothetical protein